jgi:hypothetical protein
VSEVSSSCCIPLSGANRLHRKKEKKKKILRKSFVKKNGVFLTNYGAADGCANIVLVCMVHMDYAYHYERVT